MSGTKMARKFKLFEKGQRFASIKIIAIKYIGDFQKDTTYAVKRLCCKKMETLTHERLAYIRRNVTMKCKDCRGKAGFKKIGHRSTGVKAPMEDYGCNPPTWLAPAYATQLPMGWLPR